MGIQLPALSQNGPTKLESGYLVVSIQFLYFVLPYKKVLGVTNAGKVEEEVFVADNPGQLWVKGMPDNWGFETLINSKSTHFLTATSQSDLAAKGKQVFDDS